MTNCLFLTLLAAVCVRLLERDIWQYNMHPSGKKAVGPTREIASLLGPILVIEISVEYQ